MARSMDSILSDEPSVHTLPESRDSAPEPEREESTETAKASESEPEKVAANPATESAANAKPEAHNGDDEEPEHVPDDLAGLKRALAAARGDKRKARRQWQDTEKAMAELRGRLSAMEQPRTPAQPQPKAPQQIDLNDETFFGQGPAAVKAYVEHQIRTVRDEQRSQRLGYSEAAARERHQDFQEVFSDFQKFAQSQPHLWQQMEASHDPGEFVYRTGKTFRELQGVNNIEDLRQKIEAEVRAKMQAEQSQQPAHQNQTPTPPRSIASARGTGSASSQQWTGPRAMEDILASR